MKKFLTVILLSVLLSCEAFGAVKPDIDFSKLNTMMAYSGLFNMMINPDEYLGRIIRIKGRCDSAADEETGITYYGVIIMDDTMCCAAGLDFILKDKGRKYPENGTPITVTGRFEKYTEDGETYYRLSDAELL